MQKAIEVSCLIKHYGEIRAVDEISFQVKEGELFGFLGPNGAEKTTTRRLLTGVLKPDSGARRHSPRFLVELRVSRFTFYEKYAA